MRHNLCRYSGQFWMTDFRKKFSVINIPIPGVSCSLLSVDVGLRWESILLLGLDGVELCSYIDGVFLWWVLKIFAKLSRAKPFSLGTSQIKKKEEWAPCSSGIEPFDYSMIHLSGSLKSILWSSSNTQVITFLSLLKFLHLTRFAKMSTVLNF